MRITPWLLVLLMIDAALLAGTAVLVADGPVAPPATAQVAEMERTAEQMRDAIVAMDAVSLPPHAPEIDLDTLRAQTLEAAGRVNRLRTRSVIARADFEDAQDRVAALTRARDEADATMYREVQSRSRARKRLSEVTEDIVTAPTAMVAVRAMQKYFLSLKLDFENRFAKTRRLGIDVEKLARDIADRYRLAQGVVSRLEPAWGTVRLDIGTMNGVKQDMVFTIHRGAMFVAKVRVALVARGTCRAVVMDEYLVPGRDIRLGDKARNR